MSFLFISHTLTSQNIITIEKNLKVLERFERDKLRCSNRNIFCTLDDNKKQTVVTSQKKENQMIVNSLDFLFFLS